MKTKWVKETPTEEGWYWIKYKGGRTFTTMCPAYLTLLKIGNVLVSARNDSFHEGPNHGGSGFKYRGKLEKALRFGPKIEEPNLEHH